MEYLPNNKHPSQIQEMDAIDFQRCENTWLPHVLAQVGSLVDLRMGFIAEPNASEPLGFSCMHGTSCQFHFKCRV